MTGSIAELGRRLRSGADSCVELTRRALDAAADEPFGAFVELHREHALRSAEQADRELAERVDRGPLHGIPVAVKDNIDVAGSWTRCGTPGLGHRWARRDAAVVDRLRAENAVVVGKTRTHELAWGMITPGCRNPRDPARITGGSSGGSAAAVAGGLVPAALGTDTGGSVRNPAALCGVAGLKTAAGQLPWDGIAAMAPTQDTVGVLAATVADCALVADRLGLGRRERGPRRVGLVADAWARRTEPEITAAVDRAVDDLRARGVEVVEVSLRHSDLAGAASYVIMLAEAARHWWPGDGKVPANAIGADVRTQLRLGSRVADSDYARALAVREAIAGEVRAVLREVDALLLASCPVLAAPVGADTVECGGRSIPVDAAHSALTALASVAGLPAMSVPGAESESGLPTGLQFIGTEIDMVCGCAEIVENRSMSPAVARTR